MNFNFKCVIAYLHQILCSFVSLLNCTGISADAVRILLHASLMKRDEEDGSPVITRAGFQFLLLDTAAQVNIYHSSYII